MIEQTLQAPGGASAVKSRIDGLKGEKEGMQEQRRELALLIKQAAAEVDHLTQRSREMASKMRQLDANIESFSKAEIKQLFASSQESQMRLFMMQSQLEQLRGRQANLEKMEQQLDDLLAMAILVEGTGPAGEPSSRAAGQGQEPPQPAGAASAGAAMQSIELARHRLSRQLQDGTSQYLSDLILRAEVCEKLVDLDQEKFREEMAQLRQAASGALRRVRYLVQELQPPALEEMGLVAALRRYLQSLRSAHRLQVDIHVSGQEKRLPTNQELAVFRVVQEALDNVIQHSGASRAEVRLGFDAGETVATVLDEGRGFDVDRALEEARARDRAGLTEIQTRARLVGATLEIASNPGQGCAVSLAVPA